jgi:UDP-3-O-[3-hydroxymyristoyl] glucosamine N-acyltransferase
MEFTAKQIAELLNGTVEGNPEVKVSRLSKIEEGTPGSLTFLANPAYTSFAYTTKASILIAGNDFQPENAITPTIIRVENAYAGFAKLLEAYNTIQRNKSGIEPYSYIDESATLGSNIYVGAFAYLGKNVKIGENTKIYPNCYVGDNCIIGNNTTLFPGVKVYSDCVIGNHVTLHSGVVIGADGFGFSPNSENNYQKVAQIGNVIIEDHVEIGANTTIDRATLGSTIIHKGVKLDNLIQVAHNVEIGENTVIASQTGIAGSTKIGKNCMIGGQVGINGHIIIADGTKVAGQSGITASTNENEILQGTPAFGIGEYKRAYVVFKRLPELEKKVNTIEKSISSLGNNS